MYYNIIVKLKRSRRRFVSLDLSETDLEKKILAPYYDGTFLVVNGRSFQVSEIQKINITRTHIRSDKVPPTMDFRPSKRIIRELPERLESAYNAEFVTGEFITAPSGSNKLVKKKAEEYMKTDTRKVFVVHGRDELLRKSIFDFLTAIRLDPIEWPVAINSTGEGSPYVGRALKIINTAQAIVVLLTPDDMVQLREELWKDNEPEFEKQFSGQPRPNVLIELGMALAINERATIIVQVGQIKDISDIKGRHILHLDNSAVKKNQLANRLKGAGCEVNTIGNDWLEVGNFDAHVIDKITQTEEPRTDYEPDENATKILVVICEYYKDGRTIEELGTNFSLGLQKIELILEGLEEHGYVECNRQSPIRWHAYKLTRSGREFLDRNELL